MLGWTDVLFFLGRHPDQAFYGWLIVMSICLLIAAVVVWCYERREHRRQQASKEQFKAYLRDRERRRKQIPRAAGSRHRRVG